MKIWNQSPPLFDPAYGQEETELHFYPANTKAPAGCVIICPGGGYTSRAFHEGEPYALMFNEAGIHAAVVDYRVAPYSHPAPLLDLQRAVRFVRYHAEAWNILPDKIAVCGSSAGGHLAMCAAEFFDRGKTEGDEIDRISCRPDAAILCYAVATLGPFTHGGTRDVITAGDPALVQALSGEKNVPDDCPPMFIWHTAEDQGVPVENALLMGQALSQKNIPFELHIFPHGPHGVGLAGDYPETAQWAKLCRRFLKSLEF